jgi:hypothetical protein
VAVILARLVPKREIKYADKQEDAWMISLPVKDEFARIAHGRWEM